MKKSFRSFASIFQLMRDDFPFNFAGKLASLWFDELILQVDKKVKNSVLEMVAEDENWDSATLQELKSIWTPITKYYKDYKFLSHYKQVEDARLIETVRGTVQKRLLQEKNSWARIREAAHEEIGILESVSLWMLLNESKPCCFLPIHEEQLVVKNLFRLANKQNFELFKNILVYKMPDVSHYPWSQILEYRVHPQYESYRRKMSEVSFLLNTEENNTAVEELIEEIYKNDMEKLVKLLRPSLRVETIKASASVIPLPVPINPISLFSTAIDMKKKTEAMKRYGWIYFHMELK